MGKTEVFMISEVCCTLKNIIRRLGGLGELVCEEGRYIINEWYKEEIELEEEVNEESGEGVGTVKNT